MYFLHILNLFQQEALNPETFFNFLNLFFYDP